MPELVDEMVEVTVVISENRLRAMLKDMEKAKKVGEPSVIFEFGAVNFQVYVAESEKLKEFNAKHPR
jgi:hypothetical protein